jgi:hypothetical protein
MILITRRRGLASSASAIALACGVGGPAVAQDIQQPSTTVDDIVVTA